MIISIENRYKNTTKDKKDQEKSKTSTNRTT